MDTKLIPTAIALTIVSCAFAELVSDESIEQAAASWLSSDRVAQMTMKGLSFDKIEHRGSLRVVRLSPSGYIIMSGSDIADPVISFSRNNFVDPEDGSPFHAMLEHSDSNVQKHEKTGGARTAKWMELIGGRDGSEPVNRRLRATTPMEEPSTVLIEPFMTTHWNQWQPYNDFSVVADPDADDQLYRARIACGCVATATAQQVAYFKWPWHIDGSIYCNYMVNRTGEEEPFTMRFDGHVPFDWDALLDTYSWWWGDARGKVSERERYPISRLIMWSDVILGSGGSRGSFHNTRDSATNWYERCDVCSLEDYSVDAVAKIKADLERGIPVHVWILDPYHAVVAHGFASDGESYYLYLNYGWGGSSDGWYRLYDSPMVCAFTGFRPKKMVQLEPLPKVCDNDVTVKWHLPPCYDVSVTGFEVEAVVFGSQVGSETCNFTDSVGVASDPARIYVTNGVEEVRNETDFLWFGSWMSGTYDLPGGRILTSGSVLSYRVSSADVGDRDVEILASFDGGAWQTVSRPMLCRNYWSGSWISQEVFLGEHAGKIARFRINVGWSGGRVLFDDFTLSNVIQPSVVFRQTVAPELRACTVSRFDCGLLAGVTVTPLFADGSGIKSECEFTRIAGMSNLPVPATITEYTTNDVVYTSEVANDTWSLRGTAEGDSTIKAYHAWAGGFDVAFSGRITEQSMFSFQWYEVGYYGASSDYDTISVTFVSDDGDENDFWCITNRTQLAERQLVEIPLSQFTGKSGELKVVFWHNGANWAGESDVLRFYSPRISNVAIPVLPEARWEGKNFTTLPLPRIDSVKGHDGLEIDEGLYREIGIGEDTLRVSCSKTVESLRVYPSHLSLMDDDDVTVEKIATGEFLVKMNTARVIRRSRMILTLAATDANGTTAYRDVSLRFDDSRSIAQSDRWRKIASLPESGKPVAAYTFDNSDTSNSGTGDFGLYVSSDNVTYEVSPLGRSVNNKAADGPWGNWNPDMTNEWTILTIAKTSGVNNGVVFAVGVTWGCGFALVAGDENTVKIAHWTSWTKRGEITANVPGATKKFHAYAIRGNGVNAELYVDGLKAGEFTMIGIPDFGFKMFDVYGGANYVGLANGSGEAIDDWRMYYSELPDSAIAAYTATLMQFDEEPAGVAVEEGGTVVPERWFATYHPGQTITREQLLAKAANGRSVWECYVAGLDPTDEDDDLVADITFENGVPKVSIAKGEKSNRIYRIYATKSIDGLETPLDVTNVPDLSAEPYGDYRFFRISAELP